MMPIAVAVKGKGAVNAARRGRAIAGRYGLSAQRMERRLDAVVEILDRYGCGATLPVTGAAAERSRHVIARYAGHRIEFAVHGFYHVDHVGLSAHDQLTQLVRARRLLEECGAPAAGFRAPYLRWTDATLRSVSGAGFLYDSSEAASWPIDPQLETEAYRRVLAFYQGVSAATSPVLPRVCGGIVRIPYCLPDDEAVVDRLPRLAPGAIAELWCGILHETHRRGELFTLGVHPERIEACAPGIVAVLGAARAARPGVWIARLDEVARWWRARTATAVDLQDDGSGCLRVRARGPAGVTLMARGIEVEGASPWVDGYVRLPGTAVDLRGGCRPVIGVRPSAPTALTSFLREQGYIVEVTGPGRAPTYVVERQRFARADERAVLEEIEGGTFPLVRLGRWPNGARSALCLTGDVDALTIWDYASRFLGR